MPFHRAGFVGRTEERAALATLIRRTGVVTVVGVGGVGKTRLAVQVAFDVMDDFDDGVWLVELASARDRQGIASALAAVLHLAEVQGRSLEEVVLDHLAAKAALIVLDNCEQLLEAAAGFTEQLTQRSPHVVVIATSREPLAIEGEAVWRLEPLPVTEPDAGTRVGDVLGDDAVLLFEQRAAMARPGFRVSDDNAIDVARIVHQLDGIPLAIELAAAALADRSVAGVLEGLSDRFSLLTYGRRTAPRASPDPAGRTRVEPGPPRTRRAPALRPACDVRPYRRHGRGRVVCGGAAAERVCCPAACQTALRASRCRRENTEGWKMLDSVQELALFELAGTGEAQDLAQRHRDWFTHRAESLGPESASGVAAMSWPVCWPTSTMSAMHSLPAWTQVTATCAADRHCHGAVLDIARRLERRDRAPPGRTRPADAAGLVRGRALAALGNLLLLRGDTADAEERLRAANADRLHGARRDHPGPYSSPGWDMSPSGARSSTTPSSAGGDAFEHAREGRRRTGRRWDPAQPRDRGWQSRRPTRCGPLLDRGSARRSTPETTSYCDSCSAPKRRSTSGPADTRRRRTSTARRSTWPRRSATCPRAHCCCPSSAGWPSLPVIWPPRSGLPPRLPS